MVALTPHEMRISPRKALKTRVIFEDEFGEGFLYFLSKDISLSGIFVESELHFSEGAKVFLKFSLHEDDEPIQVTGEITRLDERLHARGRRPRSFHPGLGIRFLGIAHHDLARVEAFIEN